MENILGVNPSDFGFESSSPILPSSNITKAVSSGKFGVNAPNPLDDTDIFRKTLQSGKVNIPSPFEQTTQYYDPERMKRYRGSAEYAPFMNPLSDHEKIAADNWSKLDALSVGVSGMLDNGIAAYSEYSKGLPRLMRAMYHFDWDETYSTEAELAAIGEEQKQVGLNNPIYYPEGVGQHDIFTRQFLASSFQNMGFTLGTMAGFAQETILFKKLGNLSKLFQGNAAARSVNVATEIGETSNVLSKASKERALKESAEQLVSTDISRLGKKTLFEKFAQYGKYIPIAGSVVEAGNLINQARVARATMGAAAFTEAELMRIGVGGFARAYQEWNFAKSESATEAGGTYADIYDDAIASYKEKNDNKEPDEATKQIFRQNALEGATKDYGRNVVVLAVMNKLAFGNMFRKFGIDGKYLNFLNQEGGKFYALAKTGEDAFYKVYKRKFLGAFQDAADIKKFFGTGAAVKQVGKDFVGNLGKIELLEGLQENIQEGINFSLRKQYKDLYDGKVSTWGEDFKAAVDDQMSAKGWSTFLQGALTGLFLSPITGSITRVSEVLNESKEHREQLDKVLKTLNAFGANPDAVLEEPIKNIKLQAAFNNKMTEAAKSDLKYEYFNNRSSAIIQHALYAKRTGTFEAFKTFLNGYKTEFDNQEFQEATGINVEEFGASSPAEFMSDLTRKLDRYGELYEKYNNQFGQYFTINMEDDPIAKERYSFSIAALQDAIQNVAFNEAKAEDGMTRAADIARTISEKNKTIGQSATSTFNTITDHNLGEVQISILNNEIKTLEEIEGPRTKETAALIKLKKQELEVLKQWNEAAYKLEEQTIKVFKEDQEVEETQEIALPLDFETLSYEEQRNLSDILTKYYTIKNKQNNIKDVVSKVEIKSVLQDINDYQKLGRDYKEYMASVNLLSDPKNALKAMHSFEDARIGAFARLMHDKYTELAKLSGIFEKYVTDNPKDMNELLKIARSPFTTIETSKKLYLHLANINNMIDKHNENEEAASVERANEAILNMQKDAYNKLAAAPRNVALMTETEVADLMLNNYKAEFDEDENFIGDLQRYYTDADGVDQITHTITNQQIETFFKDKENFELSNMSMDELELFIRNFEQSLFDKENAGVETPESTQEHQVISNEVKKLKNLIGKEVIYQGRKGILRRNEKGFYIELGAEVTPVSADAKADIEKSILGSFAETNERVVNSKGASNGKTLRTELVSKVSSDGEVITFKSKNSFVGEDTVVGSTPHTMTIEEFKEKFYPMLTAQDIEDFEERLEIEKEDGWNGKIYFKELRVGTSKTQKNLVGQLNLEIMIGMGKEYGFKLTRRLSDTELATLESESAEGKPTTDVIELGDDGSTETTEFTWELNEETGSLDMVDDTTDFTLDTFGIQLVENNLTEEEQTITGVNPNSQTINNHTFEYVAENTYKIDGREYTANQDEDGNLLGITYTDEDGNDVFLTAEEADKYPDSVVGELINVVRTAMVHNGVNVTQETLDEAEKILGTITPTEPIRVRARSKGQITKNLVNDMVDMMPDEVANIFDKFINNKTRNQVTDDEVKKLSAWAGDTYSKLQKLEQNEDVINAINYISKHIINPINKKYGEQIVTKPKRRAAKSSKAKTKTANVSGKTTTKGPKQGAKGISKTKKSGIVEAANNAKEQIEKHRKEMAVKMEELLPANNLFTVFDIEKAVETAQLSPKDLKTSKKQKSKQNPYDDTSLYEDFICNM